MKKILAFLLILIFSNSLIVPLYASSQIHEFLYEIGIKFYREGRYEEALHEFKKALMVQPDYEPALKYIQIIEQAEGAGKKEEELILPSFKPTSVIPIAVVNEALDLIELQREMITERKLKITPIVPLPQVLKPGIPEIAAPPFIKKTLPPKAITLDELKNLQQPIDLEQGQEIILQIRNLRRFLVTYPNVLGVTETASHDLLIWGRETGYSSLIIWDDFGRNLIDFLVVPPKPEGIPFEEILKKELEHEENFRLRYSMDWYSLEKGSSFDTLKRQSYSYRHNLMLDGPTPYGNLDSAITVQSLRTTTDVTYATIGLTGGQIGPFSKFNLRGLDYSPYFSNLVFSGPTLRGVMLDSPAFDSKLHYITFWGREGGGRYGALSPGLHELKNSFLAGIDIGYKPTEKQVYETSVIHGWGRERPTDFNRYGYDVNLKYLFDKWNMGYEFGFDSQSSGELFNVNLKLPKGNFGIEFRDINKKFLTMTGLGNRAGEIGSLVNFDYAVTDKLSTTDRLDVFKDTLYPSLENADRLNFDNDWQLNYNIDDTSSLRFNYSLLNELGRLSAYRYNSGGVIYSKSIDFIKRLNTFVGFRYQKSEYMTYHVQDYMNKKTFGGLSFNIINNLNFSISKEYDWLEELSTSSRTNPNVLDAALDWSSPIAKSKFFGNWRLNYRDEENTESIVSFLSGQDYLENFVELTYRPNDDAELFCSNRIRNVWREKQDVTKGKEVEFDVGMRYIWNTGFSWESVGSIEGYVFKDNNLDGLRQKEEAPIEGIKIYLGKDKFTLTDLFGYYQFKNVKAKNAYVTLDNKFIPKGYVLTVPITQRARITNAGVFVINYGLTAQTEISGVVFVDKNNNDKFDPKETTVPGVILTLENAKTAKTDAFGQYSFYNISPGEHTIALNLDSLPFQYLPKVPIKRDIVLYEGVVYNFDLPLKETTSN